MLGKRFRLLNKHEYERKKRVMDYNAKRAKLSGVIYIILALMLASIMCVTIFTAVSSRKDTPAPAVTDAQAPAVTTVAATAARETGATLPANAGIEAIEGIEPEETEPVIAHEEQTPEFVMPVGGKVSAHYSADLPVFSVTMNDYRTHMGIDIDASVGSEVRCCADGIVDSVYDDDMSGRCVRIEHSGGYATVYRGLDPDSTASLEVGATVSGGDVIASVSDSALFETAQSPHLHLEVYKDGVTVDPLEYLPYNEDAAEAYYAD